MAARFPDRSPTGNVLAECLRRARLVTGGVVVFDLDSTLLDNRPRQARILREFGQLHGIPELCEAQPRHFHGWDLAVAMENAGLPPSQVALYVAPAKAFWRERFFTSAYCVDDEPNRGAVEFVNQLLETGARIVYCTGRHEPMRSGTVACFERLGLPMPGIRVDLVMKPLLEVSDDRWKETAYGILREIGEVIGLFDNEPMHINGYRRAFPAALVVHLMTDHSGREVALDNDIVSIADFSFSELLPA